MNRFNACSQIATRARTLAIIWVPVLAGCGLSPTQQVQSLSAERIGATAGAARSSSIERTGFAIAHISAGNLESLAYGTAYAHAEDNVCQTADLLVTARGERAANFGGAAVSLFGFRALPNEQIDLFVSAHMDDRALARAWSQVSADAQALARGYVAGYNRYLRDHGQRLPAACSSREWVKPMTLAEFYRVSELTAIQASVGAFADAVIAAKPPATATPVAARDGAGEPSVVSAETAREAMREIGIIDSPYGSNAWAFGKDSTADGRGVLLGNPHFPWVGTNRFWQMHLTVPGDFDVMGAGIGLATTVQIGFNRDVAWSHTVSTGKRFTLHELTLDPVDAKAYMMDGKSEKMTAKTVSIQSRGTDGVMKTVSQNLWSTRWGPLIVNPRAGLNWSAKTAYALKDANSGNARSLDTWLAFARARSVADMQRGMENLGLPWVNTIAADRGGRAMYADLSVVPDVDAAHVKRCAPSASAAALVGAAGLYVLNGSRSDCDWRRDNVSPVPGLTPPKRLPMTVRSDWVHNSNDSFFYTHPEAEWTDISPLVGDAVLRGPRTRSGLIELPDLLGRGKVTPDAAGRQLFENRNLLARLVLPDLLAACVTPPTDATREACVALRGWNRVNDVDSRGAHLFREFWRSASTIKGIYREAYDQARPVETPRGLNMADGAVAPKVWDALAAAAKKVKDSGFALDAPLGSVQRPAISEEVIAVHGGDNIEGVLNNVGDRSAPGIGAKGIRIDYGTSYLQTVGFDEQGPVAKAFLTYGQSTNPASPHVTDQLKRFSRKEWIALPFHRADVTRERVGEVLTLTP